MINYLNVDESDFSLGIDARSSENQIAPGFAKDLLNADVVEKRARTRPGYQGTGGNLPVRVASLKYLDATNQVCFTLAGDSGIDLNSLRSSPLVVYGRSSSISSGGPFTTAGDTCAYYTGFTIPTRKTFLSTAGAPPFETISVPSEEHGILTPSMFVSVVESTNSQDRSYQAALPNHVLIDETSADLTVEYQNSTGQDRNVWVYYRDQSSVPGENYDATLNHTGSGSETFTISAATHGLVNFNILVQVQQDLGTTREIVRPDSVTIQPDGDVVLVLTSTTATTFHALLQAAPISSQQTGNVGGGSSGTILITELESPWLFYGVYLETTPGGDRELVDVESSVFDDATSSATVSFTNASSTPRNFVVFWDSGEIRSNQLCVTDTSVTIDASDSSPQLTIWGLDHAEIYEGASSSRSGWVTHIDSYRAAGEQRLMAGLGGNLFGVRSYAESGTSLKYAHLYPNLQARSSTSRVLGPLLWDTSETPGRTRGYITGHGSGTGWALVTAATWDVGTGWTKYTLSVPGKQILNSIGAPTSLASVLSTTTSLEDWLTLSDMPMARHNGTFRIRQILDGTNQISLWVENADVSSSDWDDSNCSGSGGVFTDQVSWLTTAPFLAGDALISAALGDNLVCSVLSSSGTTSVLDGLVDLVPFAGGILTTAARRSSLLPMRSPQPAPSSSVLNLVRGDMLDYSTTDGDWDGRLLRVLNINPDQDRTISITTSNGVATATLASGTTDFLITDRRVLVQNAGIFSGEWVISSIPSSLTFTFETELEGTAVSGTLRGSTVELDEEFLWEDSPNDAVSLQVVSRWVPVECPDDSYSLTPSTTPRHFDAAAYGSQSFLRSTIVQSNMYLNNGQDEVLKFDGTNIYRAGLFPWQPGLFVTQDTAATARIVADNPRATPSAVQENVFTVPLGDQNKFLVGGRLRHSFTGGFNDYTVLQTYENGTNGLVKVQRTSTTAIVLGASPLLTLLSIRRYYLRLNAVDANNNVVASAVTGHQDHVVELAADAAVNIKAVGMPSWGAYDYDRLEVEIYGTRLNTSAPFYRLTTTQMTFDGLGTGYIDYTDSFSDTDLIDLDATISSGLGFGVELGLGLQEPLRAKYVTSIGNSLVLANVKDYPQLDIQVVANGAVTNSTYAGKILTFRRDSSDTGTTTLMKDRARYEWVLASGAATVTAASGVLNTSLTVTVANSAVAGDWVYLMWSSVATAGRSLKYAGWWQIASANATTLTINMATADAGVLTTSVPDRALFATDPTDIPVPLGTDGNLGQINGDSFDLFDITRRLSMAMNSSMRMVDVSISGQETFTPWLTARSGNDVGRAGRILVRQPRTDEKTFEVLLPSSFSGGGQSFQMFVNGTRCQAAQQVAATTRLFPSRVLVSYQNFPEVFDSPTEILDAESESAIDVNSADGQEITGVLPFFGEAAFGASQQAAVLVVFKTSSIYLVDVNEKRAGRPCVQRIETEGLGCTFPYSIAVTRNGIIFANESGIYCLRRNQAIVYIGKYMERNWTKLDRTQLELAHGHHYGTGRLYKLSVPSESDEVFVYNHTGEDEGKLGAWTRYSNHPAIGWANQGASAFFASRYGRVLSIRESGSETDFRDDSTPITFRLDTRPMDFGNAGIRKVVDRAIVNYRTTAPTTTASFEYSLDLAQEYSPATSVDLNRASPDTGLSDEVLHDILTIRHSVSRRRGVYFQARIECAELDEPIEVAGISFKVGGLTSKGIREASDS